MVEVADYGICPQGLIKFNFKINPEFENDIKGIWGAQCQLFLCV